MKKNNTHTHVNYLKLLCLIIVASALAGAKIMVNYIGKAESYSTIKPLPPGYDWGKGEISKKQHISNREPSQDEINITQEYFRIAETYVGKFPKDFIDADDAQFINVTTTDEKGVTSKVKLEDLEPSIPRFSDSLSKQIKQALERGITQCDKPSAIFRDMKNVGCMPGSKIKRVSNDSIDWVYIARKHNKFFNDPNLFNEFGLIAYNRNSGKTVFFPGQAVATFKMEYKKRPFKVGVIAGKKIPIPSSTNTKSVTNWAIPRGGLNGGSCIACHSSGPFISFPFTDYKEIDDKGKPTYYTEKDGKPTVPTRTSGMLYDPLNYISNEEFIHFMYTYKPVKEDDVFYRNIMNDIERSDKFEPLRLVTKKTEACTACHHIGNGTYKERFLDMAFYLDSIKKDKPIDLENDQKERHERADLYLKNISSGLANKQNDVKRFESEHVNFRKVENGSKESVPVEYPMLGFHNRKIILKDEMLNFIPEKIEVYKNALDEIKDAPNDLKHVNWIQQKNKYWKKHWTLESVKKEPLTYLREQCSSCHNSNSEKVSEGKSTKILWTKADFAEVREGEIRALFRMKDNETPMPPNGRLQESVLKILEEYLKK